MKSYLKILSLLSAVFVSSGVDASDALNMESINSCVPSVGRDRKIERMADREAKKLKREGWTVAAGMLPLEYQLMNSYRMMFETEAYGSDGYLFGDALSVGEYYDAAKLQALELAKTDLAGKIQTEISALVENYVRNEHLSHSEASSVIKTVRESKNLIAQRLGRTDTVVECYRVLSSDKLEVRVVLSYSQKMVLEYVRDVMKEFSEGTDSGMNSQSDVLFL